MKRIFTLIVFLICCSQFCAAQQLEGIVTDALIKKPLANVHIRNMQTGATTLSAKDGKFTINAGDGQTVSFEMDGYEKNFAIIGNEKFIRVAMFPSIASHDTINDSSLTPYQKDSLARYQTYRSELRQGKATLKLHYAIPYGIALDNPISSWMQYLAPKTKQRLRFQKEFQKWEAQQYTAYRYNIQLVQQLTGLSADDATRFMAQYPMADDYARAATDLEIKMWVLYNYRHWKAYRN